MPCAANRQSRRTRRQDAHVNTSAACISDAPQGRGAQACRAGAPCPFGQSGPVRAAIGHNTHSPGATRRPASNSPEPSPDRSHGIPARRRRRRPLPSVRGRYMRRRRVAPRQPEAAGPRDGVAGDGQLPGRLAATARRASVGHAVRRPSRAKCRHASCKRRIASRVSPDASVQAAAPCQNSRSSPCRFGAPSFNFLRSQELPCRHCSGLV